MGFINYYKRETRFLLWLSLLALLTIAAVPHQTTLSIGQIQGSQADAAMLNQTVAFEGIVTGFLEDINTSGVIFHTIFVQDLPENSDNDPATSDGIAIFAGRDKPLLELGDHVRVRGKVTEFYGLTELEDRGLDIELLNRNVPLPEPIMLNPADVSQADLADYYERLEGMRVAVSGEARVVNPTHSGCGTAVVSKNINGQPIRHKTADYLPQIIPIMHSSDIVCDFPQLNLNDILADIVGPLTYNFDEFKIVQQTPLTVTSEPLPPAVTAPSYDDTIVTIASYNLENYFDSLNDTGSDAEPKPTSEAIALKRQKLAHAIGIIGNCPTVIGVQEVEKAVLLSELADELAATCGFKYQVSHLESADQRGIDVALLSNPARVTIDQTQLVRACTPIETGIIDEQLTCPNNESPLFSRPPIKVTATIDGSSMTFFVNHFKSKRGGEAETQPRRIAQATFLHEVVSAMETSAIVMGDFNDFAQSETMRVLTADNALTNVLYDEDAYSFIYSGAAQLIDGILLTPNLLPTVIDKQILHLNTPFATGYVKDGSAEGLPLRSSDHDMLLVALALGDSLNNETESINTSTSPTNINTQDTQPTTLPWKLIAILAFLLLPISFYLGRKSS